MATTDDAPSTSPAAHLLGWDCIEFWVGNARAFGRLPDRGAFGFRVHRLRGPRDRRRDKSCYVARAGRHPLRRHRRARRRLADRRARAGPRRRRARRRLGSSTTSTPRSRPRVDTRRAGRARAVGRDRRRRQAALRRADRARTARRGTRSSTAPTTAARFAPGYGADNLPPAPAGPAVGLAEHRPRGRPTSRRARSTTGSASTPTSSGSSSSCTSPTTRRSPPSTRRSCQRWCGTAARSCCRSTSRPTGARRARSRSTSTTYGGPGVQHIALRTDDIVAAVVAPARPRACASCACPTRYYEEAEQRAGRHRPAVGRAAAARASSSTATTTATCCRSSPRRSRTGRPCSSRSSSARRQGIRGGQLQGAVRGHRARPGAPREPLSSSAAACRWKIAERANWTPTRPYEVGHSGGAKPWNSTCSNCCPDGRSSTKTSGGRSSSIAISVISTTRKRPPSRRASTRSSIPVSASTTSWYSSAPVPR